MERCKEKFSLIKLPIEEDPIFNRIESIFCLLEKNCIEQDELYLGFMLNGIIFYIQEHYDLDNEEVFNCLSKLKEGEFWWST